MEATELVNELDNNKNHLDDLKFCYYGENKEYVLMTMRKETFEVIEYALKRYVELVKGTRE